MAIPEYILKAADEYCNSVCGKGGQWGDMTDWQREIIRKAFIAGHKATRQPKAKKWK